ncbi:hypothetical protein [Rhodoplanes roseus]|uniref:Uncharacterized protein n=1 Tax=Rhodoplanes roseus TaxID=29409 RepID=A0A327KKE9_9BRAD|nr:hypothetical protein [Rhodoplanes roseus]RAI39209.1 hypothetical protein CH341_26325 [Rhodoplanes roseus]
MVMLVALSRTHVPPRALHLRPALAETFPGHFRPHGEDGSFVIDGPEVAEQAIVKSLVPGAAGFFTIHSAHGRYSDVSKAPGRIADPALQRLAMAQTCWLSIDFVHTWGPTTEAYRFIARAMARLAPADTAVLLRPPTQGAAAFDEPLRKRLAAAEDVP